MLAAGGACRHWLARSVQRCCQRDQRAGHRPRRGQGNRLAAVV